MLRDHGEVPANPAELVAAPRRAAKLPRVLNADEVAALLDRIPTSTPLELRDRALFEMAYACGLRVEELVNLDLGSLDTDAEELRVEGKGKRTRVVPVGEHALRALGRWLTRGRPALSAEDPALFLSKSGRRLSTSDVRRRLRTWARHAAVQGASRRTPCATPSPPTCWTGVLTCARSRSCWATRASPRRRSTLG